MSFDRLTALDSSFLHLERLEAPMHVGAMSVLEGETFFDETGRFRLAEVRALVASRLHLIPRFRKRLMTVPLDAGRPIWVDDPRFEIAYHVRLAALPKPGTREQLLTLCERVQTQLLDRSRPLWELWFVEGLEGGHVGLIQKTHHALIDGVSGVDVATVLLDFTPEPTVLDAPEFQPEPPPSSALLFVESVIERMIQPAEIVRTIRRALRGPRRAFERAAQLTRSFSTFFNRDLVAHSTSLNAPVGRRRRFATVQVPFEEVKVVRQAFGGTINDVILAGVSGGLRRLLQSRHEPVDGFHLKACIPVSVRSDDERMQLGNRVSTMFVPLPIGEPDPPMRLARVRAATADLKEKEQAVGADFLAGLTEFAAPTLFSLASRLASRQPFFNLVVTNIPGPQTPLYCMGGRLLEVYPIVPVAYNLTLGIAILSYCGVLQFGLYADRDACPDLDVLAGALDDSFAELRKIAQEHLDTQGESS